MVLNKKLAILILTLIISFTALHSSFTQSISKQSVKPYFSQIPAINLNKFGFNEPSGIVFHPIRKTLFVVGDEGDICEITTNGKLLNQKHIRDADFEGITCSPKTGLLYIAVEGDEVIVEVIPETFHIKKVFWINRYFNKKKIIDEAGDGIEGITFVPDNNGGTIYVANQHENLFDKNDQSAIFVLDIDLHNPSFQDQNCYISKIIDPGIIDIRGLCYEPANKELLVLSSRNNALFVYTLDGTLLRSIPVPGESQEGVAFDESGNIFIAQDSGEILKYSFNDKK